MRTDKIKITDYDFERIQEVLNVTGTTYETLEKELARAEIISSGEMPADVVTMNSIVRVRDLNTNENMILQLVFPGEANLDDGKISIFAPVGTALLGYKVGDKIYWKVPAGIRRLRIEQLLYQPEAVNDIYA